MLFKLIYILFIVSISFGGNYHIGMTTPRQIMAIIMMMLCLFNFKRIRPYFNKYIGWYLIYLILASFSAYFDGSFSAFSRTLLAQHIVALTCYASIVLYYTRHKNFDLLIGTFLVCGLANGVVCLLQYMNNSLGIAAGYLFIDADEYSANRHMEQLIDGTGSGYLLGMRGDAVHNGYFQMFMPFLLLYFQKMYGANNSIKKVLYYTLLGFFFLVILLIQERSCIVFTLGTFVLYIYKSYKNSNNSNRVLYTLSLIVGALIIWIWGVPMIESYITQSRFNVDGSNIRETLFQNAISFISDNPIFGGMKTFCQLYEFPPHNIFLNACIEAGLIGFIFGASLYCKQIILAFRTLAFRPNDLFIYAFLAYTLNALLHNDSIISGDAIVWILWAMTFCCNSNNKIKVI